MMSSSGSQIPSAVDGKTIGSLGEGGQNGLNEAMMKWPAERDLNTKNIPNSINNQSAEIKSFIGQGASNGLC